jgi:hypothetical protein
LLLEINETLIVEYALRDIFVFLQRVWPQLVELSAKHKLVIVHETLIECIA